MELCVAPSAFQLAAGAKENITPGPKIQSSGLLTGSRGGQARCTGHSFAYNGRSQNPRSHFCCKVAVVGAAEQEALSVNLRCLEFLGSSRTRSYALCTGPLSSECRDPCGCKLQRSGRPIAWTALRSHPKLLTKAFDSNTTKNSQSKRAAPRACKRTTHQTRRLVSSHFRCGVSRQ